VTDVNPISPEVNLKTQYKRKLLQCNDTWDVYSRGDAVRHNYRHIQNSPMVNTDLIRKVALFAEEFHTIDILRGYRNCVVTVLTM